METIRDKILSYLKDHPEGVDDDKLTEALNLKYRQQANSRCRQLAKEGIIERRTIEGKIKNFLKNNIEIKEISLQGRQIGKYENEPWYWEGNVQATVAEFLTTQGYNIVRLADTRRRQRGKDIEAIGNDGPLWVTVKGFPQGTSKTKPSTQAGHWFKQALFDVIDWRGQSNESKIFMALPDFPRYRKLAEKISWLLQKINFSILWVKENGNVSVERDNL